MQRKVVKYLVFAQTSFFLCLLVAVAISTQGFSDNRGLSFYGEHLKTVIPFALGFCLCDLYLLKAAKLLPEIGSHLAGISLLLQILAILLISIVLTPDNLDGLFNVLHIVASSALFLFELLFALWMTIRWFNVLASWLLVAALFLAGVSAGLSEIHVTQYLSESSLVYQLIFGALLIWIIANVTRQAETAEMAARSSDKGRLS